MLLAQAIAPVAQVPPTTDPQGGSSDPVTLDNAVDGLLGGEVDVLTGYVKANVVPNLESAAVGLAVIFMGYFAARYLSRVISKPIRHRVDETFGRFIGTLVFYGVMGGLLAAVASKLGAPLGGLAALLAATGLPLVWHFRERLATLQRAY